MNSKHHEVTHEEVDTSFKNRNLEAWSKKDSKAHNKRQGKFASSSVSEPDPLGALTEATFAGRDNISMERH